MDRVTALNILLGFGIFSVLFIIGYGKPGKKKKKDKASSMGYIYGEVIDIYENKESGLRRIVVMDSNGNESYGFSELPMETLETLYVGKGYVQIPVKTKI